MWSIEFTNAATKEIKLLPADLQAELVQAFQLLEKNEPADLPPKLTRKLKGKLWELRVISVSGIARSIYFTVHPKKIIIVSAFVKKSQKTPKREIENAETRMKIWNSKS